MKRVLVWFSCGAASAVAAKRTLDRFKGSPDHVVEVLYCDTLAYEHPDNTRFLGDCERWLGTKIQIVASEKYTDIHDVFRKTRYLVGPRGARCTVELKKNVRRGYEKPGDIQVLGMTADEVRRIERFEDNNPGQHWLWILEEEGIAKADCYRILQDAGIALPVMYRLGYNNNNCVGCVKGGLGYWNKIRRDFPEAFERMAQVERDLNVTILKDRRGRETRQMFLDELDPDAGRDVPLPDIECGAFCVPPPTDDHPLQQTLPWDLGASGAEHREGEGGE